ncbi:MAG: hypothetical protein DRN06_06475 [Thermoprotei archaeon]|nr:MAG: hypothetical protein DRN06_06475 [Thermoprotei archaeon]
MAKRNWLILLALALAIPIISMTPLSNLGYEGTKLIFEGVSFSNNYHIASIPYKVVYHRGDPEPEWAEIWSFSEDSFHIDPYDPADYWQDLKGFVSVNTQLERDAWGNPRVDSVEWEVKIDEEHTKKIRASVYYFIHTIHIETKIDETQWMGWITHSERDDPYHDLTLYLRAFVHVWRFDGNLTDENFAVILGIEVLNYDVKGEQIVWENEFDPGGMLWMYDTWSEATGGVGTPSRSFNYVKSSLKGVDVVPDPSLSNEVIFKLHWARLGVQATDSRWSNLDAVIKIRIHVLKVDKWLLTQQHGGVVEPEPDVSPNPLVNWWENIVKLIDNMFAGPFLIGAEIFAIVAIAVILYLVVREVGD